jgi:uncharacterized protein YijF (DUF1287 family)
LARSTKSRVSKDESHASLITIRCSQNPVSIDDSRDKGDPIFGDKQDREYRIPLAEIKRDMGVCASAIARAVRKTEGRVPKVQIFPLLTPYIIPVRGVHLFIN